jgi:hypothetical protein
VALSPCRKTENECPDLGVCLRGPISVSRFHKRIVRASGEQRSIARTPPQVRRGRPTDNRPCAARSALPLLRRPHVRHRDLRSRPPATSPANCASRRNQDRYLMIANTISRIIAYAPRWSSTGDAAARLTRLRRCPVIAFEAVCVAKTPRRHRSFKADHPIWRLQQHHPCASTASARPPRPHQTAIARGTASPLLPAGSFRGGFRTTAPGATGNVATGPSSETLHKSGHSGSLAIDATKATSQPLAVTPVIGIRRMVERRRAHYKVRMRPPRQVTIFEPISSSTSFPIDALRRVQKGKRPGRPTPRSLSFRHARQHPACERTVTDETR